MLNDEMKKPEGIEAQTYGRNNNSLRDEIAAQMAEYESRSKVTVYASGTSSQFQPITNEEKLIRAQKARAAYNRINALNIGEKTNNFDNSVKRNKSKAKSGYQNLRANKDGTYMVMVGSALLGSFPLETALKKRDHYREAVGLQPAEDSA